MVNMMLGLTVASALTDSVKAKTDVEKLGMNVQMMTEALSTGLKEGKGIFWKTYAPFFIDMKTAGQLDVFVHIAAITSGNDENVKWIGNNRDKLDAFYDWLNKYNWKQ